MIDIIKQHLKRSSELVDKYLNIVDHRLNFTMIDKWYLKPLLKINVKLLIW